MQIFLIRHGETDWNHNLKIQGRSDIPLNKTGIEQAIETSKVLKDIKPTKVITSTLVRAFTTATIVSALNTWNAPIEYDDDFIERNFGELDGEPVSRYYEFSEEQFQELKLFEQNQAMISRVKSGLNKLLTNSNEDDVIVIFSHSHVLKTTLITLDNSLDYSITVPNCAVLKLEYHNQEIVSHEFVN